VHESVHMLVCMHVCVCFMYVCLFCMHLHVCARVCCVCMDVCVFICMYMYTVYVIVRARMSSFMCVYSDKIHFELFQSDPYSHNAQYFDIPSATSLFLELDWLLC